MSSEVGQGHVAIFPTFRGFRSRVTAEVDGATNAAGSRFNAGMTRQASRAGSSAGRGFSQAFNSNTSREDYLRGFNQSVAKASAALSAARIKEMDAAGRVRVAEAALAEARAKGEAGSARVIAAEERLASARRAHGASTERVRAASETLRGAQDSLAEATRRYNEQMTAGERTGGRFFARMIDGYRSSSAAASSFTGAAGTIGGYLARMVSGVQTGFAAMTSGIRTGWSSVTSFISTQASSMLTAFTTRFPRITAAAVATAGATVGAFSRVGSAISTAYGSVASTVATQFTAIDNRTGNVMSRTASRIRTGFGDATQFVANQAHNISYAFTSRFPAIGAAASSAASSMRGALGNVGSSIANGFSSAASSANSALSSIGSMAQTALAGTVVAAAGLASAAIVGGFSRLSNIEVAEAKLRGLGNSATDVASIMDSAGTAVDGTAFALNNAATVAASAAASGVKVGQDMTDYLTLAANAASATGTSMEEMGGIMNQVQAGGVAQMDNMNRVMDRGIPILGTLAEMYGVSTIEMKKMVSEGKVDAATFMQALETSVGTVATEMADTTQGAFANMNTSFKKFGAVLLGGIFPVFKEFFLLIKDGMSALTALVEPWATSFGESLAGSLSEKIAGIREIFQNIKAGKIDFSSMFDGLGGIAPIIGVVLGSLAPLLSKLPMIGSAFTFLTGPVGMVIGALTGLLAISPEFRDAFGSLLTGAIGLLVQLFQTLMGAIMPLMPVFTELAMQVGGVLATAITALMPVIGILITAVGQILAALLPLLGPIMDLLMPILGLLTPIIELIGALLTPIAALLVAILVPAVQLVVAVLTAIMPILTGIITVIAAVLGWIVEFITALVEWATGSEEAGQKVSNMWTQLGEWISQINEVVNQWLADMVTAVYEWALGLITEWTKFWVNLGIQVYLYANLIWTTITTWLANLITSVVTWATDLFNKWIAFWASILAFIVVTWNQIYFTVYSWLMNIVAQVLGFVASVTATWNSLWNGFLNIISNAWAMITNAVSTGVDTVVQFVSSIPDKIMSFFTNFGTMLYDSGRALLQGLIDGIMSMVNSVTGTVSDVINKVAAYFPHSPAKVGPLSGRGYTTWSGKALAEDFAGAIADGAPAVESASHKLVRAAALSATVTNKRGPSRRGGVADSVTDAAVQIVQNIKMSAVDPNAIQDRLAAQISRSVVGKVV